LDGRSAPDADGVEAALQVAGLEGAPFVVGSFQSVAQFQADGAEGFFVVRVHRFL
jgi:hypothetical protein